MAIINLTNGNSELTNSTRRVDTLKSDFHISAVKKEVVLSVIVETLDHTGVHVPSLDVRHQMYARDNKEIYHIGRNPTTGSLVFKYNLVDGDVIMYNKARRTAWPSSGSWAINPEATKGEDPYLINSEWATAVSEYQFYQSLLQTSVNVHNLMVAAINEQESIGRFD